MTGTAVLSLSGIVRNYGGLRPLRIKDLSIGPGERIALGGIDAVAAEALVNLVTGAALPEEGSVEVMGAATAAMTNGSEWLASLDRFGIVSDRAVMLEGSTFLQNLALPFTLEIEDIPPAFRQRVEGLAEEVGLPLERLAVRIADGSPEERARAQVARALAQDPGLLLLEHPSVTVPRDRVRALAQDLARIVEGRGIAALALTEDAAFAKPFATRWLTVQPATGKVVSARRWF